MLAVDVYLAEDYAPEAMAGIRYAVHPFNFDEDPEAFWLVISEMQQRAAMVAQPLAASRACAFGD
ncbi:hypothetical protein [Pseudomonas sp. F(2018)]|uniref:hypothetical protein n=1 Tax=Pseudomonas sp. F(2018) TaxID=2502240 RepID=UPI0010F7E042|nr:hypothetical protein [Pseudomonas sp. F(2018)]